MFKKKAKKGSVLDCDTIALPSVEKDTDDKEQDEKYFFYFVHLV